MTGSYITLYGSTVDTSSTAVVAAETPADTEFIYAPEQKVLMDGYLIRVEAVTSSSSGDAVLEVMV